MNRRAWLAGLLSILFPGLGQVYAGKKALGAAFMLAFIILGNLNAVWLSVYAASDTAAITFYGHTLPRILHDVFAFYGIVFWIWQAFDAYRLARQSSNGK